MWEPLRNAGAPFGGGRASAFKPAAPTLGLGVVRRLGFDLGEASRRGIDRARYEEALRELGRHEALLKTTPCVTGWWVGVRDGEPCIIVAVEKGCSEDPGGLLPDKLGGYDVYYVEGSLHL